MRDAIHSTLLAGALLLSGTAVSADMLDGAAIKALLSGATSTSTTSRGAPFVGKYNADGTMSGSVSDGKYTDTGTWKVVGNKYCRTWSKWVGGTEKCFDVEDIGDHDYRFNEGGGQGSTTIKITKN